MTAITVAPALLIENSQWNSEPFVIQEQPSFLRHSSKVGQRLLGILQLGT